MRLRESCDECGTPADEMTEDAGRCTTCGAPYGDPIDLEK